MRRHALTLLSALLLCVATASAAPATPGPDAGAFTCRSALNLAAGSGDVHCVGSMSGMFAGPAKLVTDGPTTDVIDASVHYDEANCPLQGTASGTVTLNGVYYADVAYTRVGTTSVVVLSGGHTGAAVAQFVIDTAELGPGLCSDTNVGVEIVGVFAAV